MDDGFTNRDFLPVRRARQTTAQGQQQVAIGQPGMGRRRGRATAGAKRQGVAFVDRRFAGHGREHRRGDQFGQLDQGRAGARRQHAGAGPQQRFARAQKRFGRRRDGLGGGPLQGQAGGLIGRRLGRHLLSADIGGQFDDHRARRAIAQRVEGPAHDRRHVLGTVNGLNLFDPAAIFLRRAEIRAYRDLVEGGPTDEQQDRHIVGIGLGQTAHDVFGAGLALHRGDPETLAPAKAAIAVGGHHGAALMAKGDRSYAQVGGGVNQRIAGKTGEPINAFLPQNRGDGLNAVHRAPPPVVDYQFAPAAGARQAPRSGPSMIRRARFSRKQSSPDPRVF